MLLSIIIPVYNTPAEKLERCFASIQYPEDIEYEIIVVDDGSRTRVGDYITEYKMHEKRMQYVYQENAGVSAARNKGIQLAKGAYVMFVDSDDTVIPYSLEAGDFSRGAEIIFLDIMVRERRKEYVRKSFEGHSAVLDKKDVLTRAITTSKINGPFGKLFDRDFLRSRQLFFNTGMIQGEDAEFGIKAVLAADKMMYIERCVYLYWHIFASGQDRLCRYPDQILRDRQILYSMKKDIVRKGGFFESHTQEELLLRLEESNIDGLFNIWTSLYVNKGLDQNIGKKIADEADKAGNLAGKKISGKVKMKYDMLVHHNRNFIKIAAVLRYIYISLFAKLK